jgi:hypothetical protein
VNRARPDSLPGLQIYFRVPGNQASIISLADAFITERASESPLSIDARKARACSKLIWGGSGGTLGSV